MAGVRKDRRKKTPEKQDSIDFVIFFVVFLLVLFGTIMIFSSSYYYALTNPKIGDMYHFLKRQLIWACAGTTMMVILMNIDYRIWKRLAGIGYVFSVVCLILVNFIGHNFNGQSRWLGIGPLSFQPSEVSKLAVILFLSMYISNHRKEMETGQGFLKCMAIIGLPVFLILINNMSTAIVVFGICAVIMFIAMPKLKMKTIVIGGSILTAILGIVGFVAVKLPQYAYRFNRIKIWRDPFSDPLDKGFQTVQSLFAVASGGLFGLGLGQSRQKTFIPEAYNDIIFAIICEELGLVGACFVILLFLILVWRGIKTAMNALDLFGTLVASGIIAMIGGQAIINISVVTNTIANTGMPLPFISYGGSSLVFTMAAVGILLNISRYQKSSSK